MGKISIKHIFTQYLKTLHKSNTRKASKADIVVHFVFPLVFGIVATVVLAKVCSIESLQASFTNAITALTIVSSLLCALAVMLFQLRMSLGDQVRKPRKTGVTDQEKILIDEMFSDVLWAVVAGFISVAFMVLASFGLPIFLIYLFVACSLVFLFNFVIVTCMCLKRLSAAYIIVSKVWS